MVRRLLLIEDDRDLRILLKEILEISFKVEVHLSASTYDSLTLLKTEQFDMIVSDYRIHLRGLQTFLNELQSEPFNRLPLIIYTGDRDVLLKPSENLRIVQKPDFRLLMQEVRNFQILSDRRSPALP